MTIWPGRALAIAGAVLISTMSVAAPAAAQGKGISAPVIIVIDLQEVVKDSTAGKGLLAQRDKYLQQYQSEFAKEEQSLRGAEQELARQRTVLSPEAFAEKRRGFEQQVVELQRKAQESRRSLEEAFGKGMNQLNQALVKVSDEIAQENGATIVLAKNQVFLHDPKMEVTKTAIERLNKRLPSVEFPTPAKASASGDKPKADKKPAAKK